jgi:hypothetical protein
MLPPYVPYPAKSRQVVRPHAPYVKTPIVPYPALGGTSCGKKTYLENPMW